MEVKIIVAYKVKRLDTSQWGAFKLLLDSDTKKLKHPWLGWVDDPEDCTFIESEWLPFLIRSIPDVPLLILEKISIESEDSDSQIKTYEYSRIRLPEPDG